MSLEYIIFICYLLSGVVFCETQTVRTSAGEVFGVVNEFNFDGEKYKVRKYLGIPYAEPPVGYMRLQKPLPTLPGLHKAINATEMRDICVQTRTEYLPSDKFQESENCLFLNIYVPFKSKAGDRKAVMIWIHGGYGENNFMNGASNFVSGDVLSAFADVIVVTFNYRLSLLGFFSAADDITNGNYGLWDQQLVIQWVHTYISYFGGDPSRVTLFGEGQGAASAILQSLYPGNKNLFQRLIAHNGTPFGVLHNGLSPFISEPKPDVKIDNSFGCYTGNVNETADCVRNIDATLLKPVLNYGQFDSHPFMPVIDFDFLTNRADMTIEENMTESEFGNFFSTIDLMVGFSDEQTAIPKPDKPQTEFREEINRALNTIYNYVPAVIKTAIINRYTDLNMPNDEQTIKENMAIFKNDITVSVPAIRTALVHANRNNEATSTFLYTFDNTFDSESKTGEDINIPNDRLYIAHMFGFSKLMLDANNMSSYQPKRSQIELSKQIMRRWTNFAKYGSPNYKPRDAYNGGVWNNFDKRGQSYTTLPSQTSRTLSNKPSVSFWIEIVPFMLDQASVNDHKSMFGDPYIKYNLETTNGTSADETNKDNSREGANAVIITLAAIVGGLCIGLFALGIFVFTLKVKQTKLKNSMKEKK